MNDKDHSWEWKLELPHNKEAEVLGFGVPGSQQCQ